MNLKEVLSLIAETAKRKGLATPFICGGTPRDKLLNRIDNILDVDITTGNADIHILAKEVAASLPDSTYRVMDDGHASILLGSTKLDFSSNFQVPNVESLLRGAGVPQPNQMQCELYSRDFTCNALLLTMDLKRIIDPTGLAIQDINRKLVRTCLPAGLTLGSQHKRVVRVMYIAAKLGFDVDREIIDWVKKNPQSFSDTKPQYLAKKLQEALDADSKLTVRLLDQMALWKYVPALPALVPYMNSPRRI